MVSLIQDDEFRWLIELTWENGARPAELFTVEADFVDVKIGTWVFPIQLSKGHKVQRVICLTHRDTSMISRHYPHLTNQPEHLRNAVNRAKGV